MNEYPLFEERVWAFYSEKQRDLPWRKPETDGSFDPYKILLSEMMLQQTQVARVVPKFQAFLEKFPNIHALATAQLAEVLKAWSGLGYNRRARYLHEAAKAIGDTFPTTLDELIKLPGIGKNTAGAILAYAFNQPVVFIETNIRTVFIHDFFADKENISDKQIQKLVIETLDIDNPREWYWALMDYGAYLKATVGNLSRASKHYAKQSKFEGSLRQVRGQVLRLLSEGPHSTRSLRKYITDDRLQKVLADLLKEKMISKQAQTYHLG